VVATGAAVPRFGEVLEALEDQAAAAEGSAPLGLLVALVAPDR
jgi:hypothetical protein